MFFPNSHLTGCLYPCRGSHFIYLLSRPIAIIEIFSILVFVRFHKYKVANTPNLRTFAAKMGQLSIIGFHLQ